MIDISKPPVAVNNIHTSEAAKARLKKRYSSERRFKMTGLFAVLAAAGFLIMLVGTIARQALPIVNYHYAVIPVDLSSDNIDKANPGAANFDVIIRDAIRGELPYVSGRSDKRELGRILSSGAGVVLRREVLDNPTLISGPKMHPLLMDDYADLYLKGKVSDKELFKTTVSATPSGASGKISVSARSPIFKTRLAAIKTSLGKQAAELRRQLENSEKSLVFLQEKLNATNGNGALRLEKDIQAVEARIANLDKKATALEKRVQDSNASEKLTKDEPSLLVHINNGVVKLTTIGQEEVEGIIVVPLDGSSQAQAGSWSIEEIQRPEALRKVSDKQIIYIDQLVKQGRIERKLNTLFFSGGASRDPEMAGIWGAVVGSFLTMLVTLAVAFPLGVAAAIYLEEFAPKNKFTDLIEVNINNLAAVPSIVFGLLGLAVFLNVFGMPRSAPVVGGIVLALMTLPTIIIASRAALRAVPPSIRQAALGIGASKLQAVFHHVLPLAMPGMLTGTIIGMAQALGETAPLLMIGMVAFIVDIPGGFTDPATVLPVQIYMWADFPEPAFQQKTSAAIIALLIFLVIMNALAVIVRKRFERRW